MRRFLCMLILLLSTLSVGCSTNGVDKTDATIRILVEDVSQTDTQAYRALREEYPNVSIEWINGREQVEQPLQLYENFEELYVELNPDVVITNQTTFPILSSQGYLLNLESRMSQDGILLEQIHAPVMESIQDSGNGQVNGLSPYFDTEVLMYNTNLFDEFGISYPDDQMTWEEILDLIMRFPASNQQGDAIFGLYDGYEGSAASLLDRISRTEGLSYLDWDNKQVTYQDSRWIEMYTLVSRVVQSDVLLNRSTVQEEGQQPVDLFKQNKLAVMLGDYETFVTLSYDNDLEFGVVTQPVAEGDRSAGHLYVNNIYSVNANSPNIEIAWKFIQAAMGQNEPDKLPVTLSSLVQKDERADVFYKLDYKREDSINFWEVPIEFSTEMNRLRHEALTKIVSGEGSSVQEVLKQLETDGQNMLESHISK